MSIPVTAVFFSELYGKSKIIYSLKKNKTDAVLCASLNITMILAATFAVLGDSGAVHPMSAPSWPLGSEA